MEIEQAKQMLLFHSNQDQANGFLYTLKQGRMVSKKAFVEIMDAVKCLQGSLSYKNMDGEIVKNYYTIIFWCRGWLAENAWLRNERLGGKLADEDLDLLVRYVEIMEEVLYYLILDNQEDAFWSYEELLDGR